MRRKRERKRVGDESERELERELLRGQEGGEDEPSVIWNPEKSASRLEESDSCPIEIQVSVTTTSASLRASAGEAVKRTEEACPNSALGREEKLTRRGQLRFSFTLRTYFVRPPAPYSQHRSKIKTDSNARPLTAWPQPSCQVRTLPPVLQDWQPSTRFPT